MKREKIFESPFRKMRQMPVEGRKIKNRKVCQYFSGSDYYFNGEITKISDDKK